MPKTIFDMGKNLNRDGFENVHIDPSKYTIGIDFSTVEEIRAQNEAANASVDRVAQRMRDYMDSLLGSVYGSTIFDGGTRIREPFVYSNSKDRQASKPDDNVIDLSPEDYREVKEVRELPEVTGEDKPI